MLRDKDAKEDRSRTIFTKHQSEQLSRLFAKFSAARARAPEPDVELPAAELWKEQEEEEEQVEEIEPEPEAQKLRRRERASNRWPGRRNPSKSRPSKWILQPVWLKKRSF